MLRTRNNRDGNKLVIFSNTALYNGDTYIHLFIQDEPHHTVSLYSHWFLSLAPFVAVLLTAQIVIKQIASLGQDCTIAKVSSS